MLRLSLHPLPARATVVALPYFFGHGVALSDDHPGFLGRDRFAIHLPELIGTVLGQDDAHTVEQISTDVRGRLPLAVRNA